MGLWVFFNIGQGNGLSPDGTNIAKSNVELSSIYPSGIHMGIIPLAVTNTSITKKYEKYILKS